MQKKFRVAVFNDTRGRRHHVGCDLVMGTLEKKLNEYGIAIEFLWPATLDWREHRAALPPKGAINGIIVNGEGTLHGSPSRQRAAALAELPKLAHEHYGCPAFLLNSTIYENNPETYESIRLYDMIFVRDSMSQNALHNFQIASDIVPDLSFSSGSLMTNTPTERERSGIGITDSVLKEVNNNLLKLARAQRIDFFPIKEKKNRPYIYSIIKNRINRIKGEKSPLKDPDRVESYVDWILNKELIITGRYHAACLCILTHTPLLAFESNTPKISALLTDVFGNTERVINLPTRMPKVEINNNLYSNKERENIDGFIRHTKEKTQQMFEKILNAIKSNN